MASAAEIAAALAARYPQFAPLLESGQLELFAQAAPTHLPTLRALGSKADEALLLKTGILALPALGTASSDTGSAASSAPIKRVKEGDLEIEYAVSTSSQGKDLASLSGSLETLLEQLLAGVIVRPSPHVTGWRRR